MVQKLALDNSSNYELIFKHSFEEEIKKLKDIPEDHKKLLKEMKTQGLELASIVLYALKTKFPGYQVISSEEQIITPIDDLQIDYNFKGFLDLVLRTPDGKYHIIDWKSCSWGWSSQKKTDPLTTYQLTYYKNYFSKKHNIDIKNIKTYFALLKRTAKKDKVEILEVSSGQKKTTNALKLLQNAVINIENKNYVKNRLNCKYCKFYKTENCI